MIKNVDCIKHDIANILQVSLNDITDIRMMKKGMTNHSITFYVKDNVYIMRIPGEGTEELINRTHEYNVYQAINGLNISDRIIYVDPQSGYKISVYEKDARVCNSHDWDDVQKCMLRLKQFHNCGVQVEHTFDLFSQIEFYESLWGNQKSEYPDYSFTKKNIFLLKQYIESQPKQWGLAHIDAVPENFLFISSDEDVRLIDWEYAGMQDVHVDIAMFAIYSLYNKKEVDRLIDIYFGGVCEQNIRKKIYCYVAICGLLWSNWCEYKKILGVQFGYYAQCQYQYAKDFYELFLECDKRDE